MEVTFGEPSKGHSGQVVVPMSVDGLKTEISFVRLPDGKVGGPSLSLHGWGGSGFGLQGNVEREEAAMNAAKRYKAEHLAQIDKLLPPAAT